MRSRCMSETISSGGFPFVPADGSRGHPEIEYPVEHRYSGVSLGTGNRPETGLPLMDR